MRLKLSSLFSLILPVFLFSSCNPWQKVQLTSPGKKRLANLPTDEDPLIVEGLERLPDDTLILIRQGSFDLLSANWSYRENRLKSWGKKEGLDIVHIIGHETRRELSRLETEYREGAKAFDSFMDAVLDHNPSEDDIKRREARYTYQRPVYKTRYENRVLGYIRKKNAHRVGQIVQSIALIDPQSKDTLATGNFDFHQQLLETEGDSKLWWDYYMFQPLYYKHEKNNNWVIKPDRPINTRRKVMHGGKIDVEYKYWGRGMIKMKYINRYKHKYMIYLKMIEGTPMPALVKEDSATLYEIEYTTDSSKRIQTASFKPGENFSERRSFVAHFKYYSAEDIPDHWILAPGELRNQANSKKKKPADNQ